MNNTPACIATHANATRNRAGGRAWTIGELPNIGYTCPLTIKQIHDTIKWLNVEKSARYQPTGGATYCNVYASDLLHLLGVYLPRQWWQDPNNASYPIKYGENTYEMNANGLHDWMLRYGPSFGWRITDAIGLTRACTELQVLGTIIARRRDRTRSGHVTVALPYYPKGLEGDVVCQTQAGTRNKQFFRDKWWTSNNYDSVVFAYNTGTMEDGRV